MPAETMRKWATPRRNTFEELAEMLERTPSRCLGQGVSETELNTASARPGVNLAGDYRLFEPYRDDPE
ncbi:hypothetical protein JQX13_05000 [Archangium violaceum]|uniref:hypothetical protein n=1 Tax=Archangium violaceum TaxID=83451 RepID=UPI00193BC120|nr:hypothetical protein [Archangium violaceum]QRK09498.1 hypothetical protein JQX13_05000 [Archangium violaceum]